MRAFVAYDGSGRIVSVGVAAAADLDVSLAPAGQEILGVDLSAAGRLLKMPRDLSSPEALRTLVARIASEARVDPGTRRLVPLRQGSVPAEPASTRDRARPRRS